jgi:hypothetical protein
MKDQWKGFYSRVTEQREKFQFAGIVRYHFEWFAGILARIFRENDMSREGGSAELPAWGGLVHLGP